MYLLFSILNTFPVFIPWLVFKLLFCMYSVFCNLQNPNIFFQNTFEQQTCCIWLFWLLWFSYHSFLSFILSLSLCYCAELYISAWVSHVLLDLLLVNERTDCRDFHYILCYCKNASHCSHFWTLKYFSILNTFMVFKLVKLF